jgi:hypothetical protein
VYKIVATRKRREIQAPLRLVERWVSHETIVRQIVGRDLPNQDLSAYTISKTEAALYELACEEFGSWETALECAGVRTRMSMPIDKEWTR